MFISSVTDAVILPSLLVRFRNARTFGLMSNVPERILSLSFPPHSNPIQADSAGQRLQSQSSYSNGASQSAVAFAVKRSGEGRPQEYLFFTSRHCSRSGKHKPLERLQGEAEPPRPSGSKCTNFLCCRITFPRLTSLASFCGYGAGKPARR